MPIRIKPDEPETPAARVSGADRSRSRTADAERRAAERTAAEEPRGMRRVNLALAVIFVLLLINPIACDWTNPDEAGNIVAGLYTWKFSRFDLYCVNPPLFKVIAAAPLLPLRPEIEWERKDDEISLAGQIRDQRPEFSLAVGFVRANPDRIRLFLILARLTMIPFALLGAYYCCRWARELFGGWAGTAALALWLFNPNVLTWSSEVLPDLPAAALGATAWYYFWKWFSNRSVEYSILTGFLFGLALLSKMTWIVLFPLVPAVVCVFYLRRRRQRAFPVSGKDLAGKTALVLLTALFTLNLGYGFEGTFKPLGNYRFRSRALSGKMSDEIYAPKANRFADTPLAYLPVPFPSSYIKGIDLQKLDFERGFDSYINGKWSDRGWWYFYLECFLLKTPIGTLVLFFAALFLFLKKSVFAKSGRASLPARLFLLLPAAVVFIFVSSQTGFSWNFRYVLPVFPFLAVWVAQTAGQENRNRAGNVLTAALILCSFLGTLGVYPHFMSYFNILAGGPKNGHRYLLNSCIDWGQDMLRLRKWIETRPEIEGLHLLPLNGVADALFYGKGYLTVPPSFDDEPNPGFEDADTDPRLYGPRPGWHAASIARMNGKDGKYKYLLDFEPAKLIGYSIYVYDVSFERANAARGRLGLPPIPAPLDRDELYARLSRSVGERELNIALFRSETAGSSEEAWKNVFDSDPLFHSETVSAKDIRQGKLAGFDLLVVPGGKSSEFSKELHAAGKKAIRDFVESGGGYFGVCAGAFLAAANTDGGLSLANVGVKTGQRFVPGVGTVSAAVRGGGDVSIALTGEGKALLPGWPEEQTVRYTGGPVFSDACRRDLNPYVVLADFTSETFMYEFQKGEMIGTPAVILTQYGNGRVLLSSGHPEFDPENAGRVAEMIRLCAGPEP